jgi:hypothetical protein
LTTAPASPVDEQRRFGGLQRLYGVGGAQQLRTAHVAVVGVGGVGAWAVEALARSGVGPPGADRHGPRGRIQHQPADPGAGQSTLGHGQGRGAGASELPHIHPGCEVLCVEDFASADNWPQMLPAPRGRR